MTATYAYDHHLPCLNPHCKSHGRPHPNCRCYGLALGGVVGEDHYCSQARHHKPWCEFYQRLSEGGNVLPSFEQTEDVLPKFDDTEPHEMPAFEDSEHVAPNTGDFIPSMEEGIERAKTTAEGLLHTFVPFGRQLEVASGITTPEKMKEREERYGGSYNTGNVAGGIYSMTAGPMKYLGKAAGALGEMAGLSEKGAKAFATVSQIASQNTSDALSKYLLGGSPENANEMVAHLAIDTGIQTALSFGLPLLGKGIATGSEKLWKRAAKELMEVANKGEPLGNAKDISKGFATGISGGLVYGLFKHPETSIAQKALTAMESAGTWAIRPYVEKIIDKGITPANKYVSDTMLKILSTDNPQAASMAEQLGTALSKSARNIYNAVEPAFTGSMTQIVPMATEKQKQKMREMLDEPPPIAGADPYAPKFAKGGEVGGHEQQDHFATVYPEANVLMQNAKGRVHGYLNSIKPSKLGPSLPFDSKTPQKAQERSYNSAIEYAINPLSIMNKVAKGDLAPEDMKHFVSMWPEVHSTISKKLTEKIVKAQLNGEKPNYKNRQAMSLFLGAPLDSTFTPQAIQTIQATFALKQAAQQQPQATTPKKSTAQLSKEPTAYLTGEQARTGRGQIQKI